MGLEELADLAAMRRLLTHLAAHKIKFGHQTAHQAITDMTDTLKALPPEILPNDLEADGVDQNDLDQAVAAHIEDLMNEVRNQL